MFSCVCCLSPFLEYVCSASQWSHGVIRLVSLLVFWFGSTNLFPRCEQVRPQSISLRFILGACLSLLSVLPMSFAQPFLYPPLSPISPLPLFVCACILYSLMCGTPTPAPLPFRTVGLTRTWSWTFPSPSQEVYFGSSVKALAERNRVISML